MRGHAPDPRTLAGGRKFTDLTLALTLSRPVKGLLVYLSLERGVFAVPIDPALGEPGLSRLLFEDTYYLGTAQE